MTISSGSTILASDIQAIKDDVDAVVSASTATVATSESTTSSTFADLSTSGPSVTLTTGTAVLVCLKALMSNDTAGASAVMSVAVSGASSVSASINSAISYKSGVADDSAELGATFLLSGLTAGSNTFTAKYRQSGGGTASFVRRDLVVIPLGA